MRRSILCSLLAALLTASCWSATGLAQGRSQTPETLHVVAVGIVQPRGYANPIPGCDKDARDIEKWARAQQGKLARQVSARTFTNADATRNNVLAALDSLRGQVKPGDYTIVYLSTHGGRGNGGFAADAYDGKIRWQEITNRLSALPGTKIVILDTCHAGAISASEGLIVFSACLAHQFSSPGSHAAENSVFTKYFLEALNGRADINQNGVVSLAETAAYVSGRLELSDPRQICTLYRPVNVPDALPLSRVSIPVAAGNGPAPAATPRPAAVPPTAANPGPNSALAGSVWQGRETGAGDVRFEFRADGTVLMIDNVNRRPVQGTWTLEGQTVTLRFASYVYRGQLNGTRLSGSAAQDGRTWTFAVNRR